MKILSEKAGWGDRLADIDCAMVTRFSICLLVLLILNSFAWEWMAGGLYDCTDGSGLPGYWDPGNWVHEVGGRPVMMAARVVHGRAMDEPDMLKIGWTSIKLGWLWLAISISGIGVSLWVARLGTTTCRKGVKSVTKRFSRLRNFFTAARKVMGIFAV